MTGLINVTQAHKLSKISYNTIYVAARDGRIDGATQIGSRNSMWLFTEIAFKAWAENEHRPIKKRVNGNGRPG